MQKPEQWHLLDKLLFQLWLSQLLSIAVKNLQHSGEKATLFLLGSLICGSFKTFSISLSKDVRVVLLELKNKFEIKCAQTLS